MDESSSYSNLPTSHLLGSVPVWTCLDHNHIGLYVFFLWKLCHIGGLYGGCCILVANGPCNLHQGLV
ncbi:hypothetical protein V6N11_070704 [Hibiscus sabdariffa]|uniref:Uncharacterized protein n=1 Tax=Hibiscus sabdariffa TaxID=183260 RepID=A0ABR2QFT9_9ROSI